VRSTCVRLNKKLTGVKIYFLHSRQLRVSYKFKTTLQQMNHAQQLPVNYLSLVKNRVEDLKKFTEMVEIEGTRKQEDKAFFRLAVLNKTLQKYSDSHNTKPINA